MHLGFLTSEYPGISKLYGGIATSIRNMAISFVGQGHDVSIFLYGQEEDETIEKDNIKIVKIRNKSVKGLSWWFTRKKIEQIINREVHENHLQILEAPDWTGITAFMNIDCPVVLKLHGSDTYFCHIEGRKQKYKNFFLEKRALHSADSIVSVSQYTANLTKKLFSINRKIVVIPNGIDINMFNYDSEQDMEPKTVLYFGTLIRKKGVLELPYIFNSIVDRVPDVKLYLIGGDSADIQTGSPSTWKLMKPLFSERALERTNYFGKVPHDEMKEYIKKANVCIFPSFAEAFPISWLEAMASGKPIVGSDKGWAKEAIEDKVSGFLVDPKNHAKYAERIVQLFSDKNMARSIGEEAQKRVKEEFSIHKIADKHIHYYKEIIEGES